MRTPSLLLLTSLVALTACGRDAAAPPSGFTAAGPSSADAALVAPDDSEIGALRFGFGHYCSKVSTQSGAWSFDFGSADPCAASLPTGTIMRGGMYRLNGLNRVVAHCKPTYIRYYEGMGVTPLTVARAAALRSGPRPGACTFTVSPKRLAIFDLPYGSTATFPANYHGSGFDFMRPPYSAWGTVDHRGLSVSFIDDHDAHDFGMPRGTPLLAVADGVIITGGMFSSGVSNRGCNRPDLPDCGLQGIVIVKHTVAAGNPAYDEVFGTGYFHVQAIPRWILSQCTPVDTTQAWPGVGGVCSVPVKRGQVVAYSGNRGSSSAPHLHFATWRMTNTQAFGHVVPDVVLRSPFPRQNSVITEPTGWHGSGADPWATKAIVPTTQFPNGAGTLSIHLWKVDPPIHW